MIFAMLSKRSPIKGSRRIMLQLMAPLVLLSISNGCAPAAEKERFEPEVIVIRMGKGSIFYPDIPSECRGAFLTTDTQLVQEMCADKSCLILETRFHETLPDSTPLKSIIRQQLSLLSGRYPDTGNTFVPVSVWGSCYTNADDVYCLTRSSILSECSDSGDIETEAAGIVRGINRKME